MFGSKINVLIADDEKRIIKLIRLLGDWEKYSMEIIGEASSGEEALQLIAEKSPDLVITDIRMPGFDGLEVIGKSIEKESMMEFIVISGYKHFEYAKKAISLGVSNYLTKPIVKEELNDALEAVSEKFLKKNAVVQQIKKSKLIEREKISSVRKTVLKNLCLNKEKEVLLQQDLFQFKPGKYQVLLMKIDGLENVAENQHLLKAVDRALAKNLTSFYDFEVTLMEEKFLILINYPESVNSSEKMYEVIQTLLLQSHIFEELKVTVGMGKVIENPADFFKTLVSARCALNQRLMIGCNRVIEPSEESYGLNKSSYKVEYSNYFDRFVSSIEGHSISEMQNSIALLQNEVAFKHIFSGTGMLKFIDEIMITFSSTVQYLKIENNEVTEKIDYFKSNLIHFTDINQLFEDLNELLTSCLEIIVQENNQKESKPITDAKKYMKEHFSKPLTLDSVSEKVGFSSSHFSMLFKNSVGLTFSEYLQDLRINEAKKMLRETTRTVADICQEVGYSDIKSFNKTFKKQSTLTPKEYRRIYA